MSEKLAFSLVSPECEVFNGQVEHVIAPGVEGEFGVLPQHAPFMSTLKSGLVRVLNDDNERRFFVHNSFADVTAGELTILAERAVDINEVDQTSITASISEANEDLSFTRDEAAKADLRAKISYLEALNSALDH